MKAFSIKANLVDVLSEQIYPAEIVVEDGNIRAINKIETHQLHSKKDTGHTVSNYIMPGFIDAHVHIESSMLVPSEFARLAVAHGTVATVSDPHEIANVCGMNGVEFMINNGKTVPFKFHFGAPSCVPATVFETAGATLDANDVSKLLQGDDIYYLSEMMNFPGVLNEDDEVMKKIQAAHHLSKPVDGHAPGLRGDDAKKYISAGITTDHECFTREEALDKLQSGMKIIIREGSAAKNFEALVDLLHDYPNQMMFCSDDKHPDSLVAGHINQLCARAVAKGINLFKILKAACINPAIHYKMKVGQLKVGDAADFILVKNLKDFDVAQTYIDGKLVAENGISRIETATATPINNFSCTEKKVAEFSVESPGYGNLVETIAIEALDGQLITNKIKFEPLISEDKIVSDRERDNLKIVVVNRYRDAPIAKAFVKNFGLKSGALASSVAHDSHNIVAVGVDDLSICKAVNMVIASKGGVSFVNGESEMLVALPVAGLMSNEDGYRVANEYSRIDKAVKAAGSTLSAPFMTLSFMALLVIPHLKLSDLGLFDGDSFQLLH